MGIELKKGENVFFPAPYVPSEPAMIVVTDKRVIYFGDAGRQEISADKITFTNRRSGRPYILICVLMAIIGLPIAAYGAWMWYGVKDMKTFAEMPPMTEDPGYEDPAITRIKAMVIGALGAALVGGAYLLIKKKRYEVLVRGGTELMIIRVPDELKQTQILMTLDAMIKTIKAMKGGPAASSPPAKA